MNDAIDFVLLYVDHTDPVWQEKKKKYQADAGGDQRDIRYRTWDNLRYWFRAVAKFAPWVNKVYLVTDHQAPDWLDRNCEKLVLVNHEDFIPETYLPVFSSHPIELNLFRIKELSEQFVYFNDDVFLLRPALPEQFFRNGLPCDYAVESPPVSFDRLFAHVLSNNLLLLNEQYDRREVLRKQFRKFYSPVDPVGLLQNLAMRPLKRSQFIGFRNFHCASNLLKSACEEVWQQSREHLERTCRARFRSDQDVNQYIFLHHQYVTGQFSPFRYRDHQHMYRCEDSNVAEIVSDIKTQKYGMICINETDEFDFEKAKKQINAAFEQILPEPSIFEK